MFVMRHIIKLNDLSRLSSERQKTKRVDKMHQSMTQMQVLCLLLFFVSLYFDKSDCFGVDGCFWAGVVFSPQPVTECREAMCCMSRPTSPVSHHECQPCQLSLVASHTCYGWVSDRCSSASLGLDFFTFSPDSCCCCCQKQDACTVQPERKAVV